MIEVKLENIDALRKAFDPKIVKQSLDRAIRTAAERVRTQISRDVRQRYNIKAGDVGKSVTLRAISQDGIVNRLLAYTGARISLARFGARPRQVRVGKRKYTGVTVQVLKAEPRQLVKGAFLAQGLNANEGTPQQVFQRIGDARLPIRKLTGPAIPTMVANPKIIAQASDTATDVMNREFIRQMELLMSKTGAA